MADVPESSVELRSVFQDPNFDPFVDAPQIAVPHFDYSDPGLPVAGVNTAVDAPVPAPDEAPQWVAPTPTPAPAQSASTEGV